MNYKLNNYNVIPDIIILEDSIQGTSKNNSKYEKYYNINIKLFPDVSKW